MTHFPTADPVLEQLRAFQNARWDRMDAQAEARRSHGRRLPEMRAARNARRVVAPSSPWATAVLDAEGLVETVLALPERAMLPRPSVSLEVAREHQCRSLARAAEQRGCELRLYGTVDGLIVPPEPPPTIDEIRMALR